MRLPYRPLLVGVALAATACGGSTTQTLVLTLGRDTVAIEQFNRTDTLLTGQYLGRSPETRLTSYEARLDTTGVMTDFRWAIRSNPEDPPQSEGYIRFENDSAYVDMVMEGEREEFAAAAPRGSVPLVDWFFAFGLYHQGVIQAMAAGGDSVPVQWMVLPPRGAFEMPVLFRGGDTAAIKHVIGPMVLALDRNGRLVGATARETTMAVEIAITDSLNVDSLAREYWARDARGEGMGALSRASRVNAEIDGAAIEIRYSRPSVRGRRIFGGLVPYDTVWRTGANAATHFTTDRDLRLGALDLPANTYTLFSYPTADSMSLVISSETGQWGTFYKPEHDFARVPMVARTIESVEMFTIAVTDTEAGGRLSLAWDTSEFYVDFEVAE